MKQIGTLSSSACSKLFSSSMVSGSANLLLAELSSILEIKSFKDKAKTKSITSRDSLYITIIEEKTYAKFHEKSSPGEKYTFFTEFETSLSMKNVCNFQKFNRFYVLPYSVETHECSKEEPCPDCNNGKCAVCGGEKIVTCDACDGEKKCSCCDGTGEYPCKSCDSSGVCPACDGTGKYPCQDCNETGECQSCGGSGRYPCYSCNETGECRHCDGSGVEDCDDCDGDGWVWDDCHACHGTGRYTLRNGYDVKCRVCHGSGHHHKEDCWTCDGTGSVGCHVCDGSGRCEKCGGEGNVECRTCHGDGKCTKCRGKGYLTCKMCNGATICAVCKGKGYVRCRACHGDGICGKCKGKGTLGCLNCNKTGICPICNGSQHIPCHICNGVGVYQTFLCVGLKTETRKLQLRDKTLQSQFGINFSSSGKNLIYQGTPYIIDFGNSVMHETPLMDFLNRTSNPLFKDKIIEYRNTLFNVDGSPSIADNIYILVLL